jgi:hypothetical protein
MPSEQALAFLKEDKIKPRKTSYDVMSTWIFTKPTKYQQDFNPEYPFESVSNLSLDGKQQNIEPKTELFQRSNVTKDYLMSNWSLKRLNQTTFDKTWSRYGRCGGAWNNVKESLKGDGTRFLFINGAAKTNENLKKFKSNSTTSLISFNDKNSSLENYQPKPKEKHNIHTKLAIERDHWNIVR